MNTTRPELVAHLFLSKCDEKSATKDKIDQLEERREFQNNQKYLNGEL